MAIEEKEQKETILDELIEKVEKDPLPTNIFTTEDTDPLVLLGKLNEVIAHLKALRVIISESDSKATEALTKAIESLTIAQEAITTATTIGNEAKTLAQNALEQANSAHDTAGEALMEATDALTKAEQAITTATTLGNEAKTDAQQAISTATTLGNEAKALAQQAITTANEALSQVVQGLGTKVYDTHGNLMSNAKFTGHNGVNVDMDENDPQTFNIRLDNTITEAIEETYTQAQTNKSDIVNLTDMLSTTEELAQQASEELPNKVNKNGDTMTGKLNAHGGISLNGSTQENANLDFFLGINAFASGGNVQWSSKPAVKQALGINDKIEDILIKFAMFKLGEASEHNVGVEYEITKNGVKTRDYLKLIESNGYSYMRFMNGIQICWGERETSATGQYTNTFPKPFSAGTYKVLFGQGKAGAPASASDFWNGYRVVTRNPSNFIYEPAQRENHQCFWLAIGNWV